MAKNIVMCFDGTDNSVHGDPSNVLRLYECLEHSDRQLTYYDPGVGTLSMPESTTDTTRLLSKLVDSAIGHSLRDKFCQAYRFLSEHYQPGDSIYFFGFSRGAYTARVVAAGVHAFGLLKPSQMNLVPYVWSLLLNEPKEPSDQFLKTHDGFRDRFRAERVPIEFLGVWDTVSSMGWLWDFRTVPHTAGNPSVRRVRHAVSIDERRAFFRTNLFCFTGKEDAQGKRRIQRPIPEQDLKEVWFAGVHSDIGGGYPPAESGLARIALAWMIREACTPSAMGSMLYLDMACKERVLAGVGASSTPDHLAMIHNSLTFKWWLGEVLFRRSWNSVSSKKSWRWPNFCKRRSIAPGSFIHQSVLDRMQDPKARYAPKNWPGDGNFHVEN